MIVNCSLYDLQEKTAVDQLINKYFKNVLTRNIAQSQFYSPYSLHSLRKLRIRHCDPVTKTFPLEQGQLVLCVDLDCNLYTVMIGFYLCSLFLYYIKQM